MRLIEKNYVESKVSFDWKIKGAVTAVYWVIMRSQWRAKWFSSSIVKNIHINFFSITQMTVIKIFKCKIQRKTASND